MLQTCKLFLASVFIFLIQLDGLSQTPGMRNKDCSFERINIDEITGAKTVIYELQTVSGDLFKGLHCQVLLMNSQYYIGIASSNGSARTLCFKEGQSQMEFQFANDSILVFNYVGEEQCSNTSVGGNFLIGKENLNQLLNTDVVKIRLQYTETYIYYELPRLLKKASRGKDHINPQQYFRTALFCVMGEVN